MKADPCYIEGDTIWFPRRTDELDIGVKVDSIIGVMPDTDTPQYSMVYYYVGQLRAFESAKTIAETLWGKGNFKKTPTGAYVHKDL